MGRSSFLDIGVPKNRGELTDGDMAYFAKCAAAGLPDDEVRAAYVIRKAGRKAGLCTPRHLAVAAALLGFLDEMPEGPFRPSAVNGHEALPPALDTVSFELLLTVENLYQACLGGQSREAGRKLAAALYPGLAAEEAEDWMVHVAVVWVAGLKALNARRYPRLYRPAAAATADGGMLEITNAQIRALTGGDVTKENAVLQTPAWRALTELDAKAREAQLTNNNNTSSHEPRRTHR